MEEEREREKKEWVGRVSDYSSVPRKAQPGRWVVLAQSHLLEEFLISLKWASILIMLSHWLGEACAKHGIYENTGMDPVEQQAGPSVSFAPCPRRS